MTKGEISMEFQNWVGSRFVSLLFSRFKIGTLDVIFLGMTFRSIEMMYLYTMQNDYKQKKNAKKGQQKQTRNCKLKIVKDPTC